MRRAIVMCITLICILSLSACGYTSAPARQAFEPSVTPRPISTPRPIPTPIPMPDMLSYLEEYFSSYSSSEEYSIKKAASPGYIKGEYRMSLVLDEASEANGTADVLFRDSSDSFEIDFSYSNFMGAKVCAPSLIKSVSSSAIRAICDFESVPNQEAVVREVISSYDEKSYSSLVVVGRYAVVFAPSDIYASILYFVDVPEYEKSHSVNDYTDCVSSDLSQKLNSGEDYKFSGIVKNVQDGKYKNSFAEYRCRFITVQMMDGNNVQIAQFPERVPVDFVIGETYTFCGSPMFDAVGNALFYLEYVK